MNRRILMTGGGTGGALTPLLAVASELRRRDPAIEIRFLVTKNPIELALAKHEGFSAQTFPAGKWRRYFDARNIRDLFVIGYAFLRAFPLLRGFRPDVVVSAGSFLSVPIVWAAKFLGIPVLIHQQDVAAGLANRLMASSASVVTVTFEESVLQFSKNRVVRWTGNPVREEMHRAVSQPVFARFGLEENVPQLVVLGGSSGARFFSELMQHTAQALVTQCQILHITGRNTASKIPSHPRYHPIAFLSEGLADCFAAAALVVTRAGLSTLSELGVVGTPIIVIPMPFTHQEANARLFGDRHAAVVLDERTLTPEAFVQTVSRLLASPNERQALKQQLQKLVRTDAAARIADEVSTLIPKR